MIRSNKTAAFIVDQLKSETTLDSIVDAMFEKYDAPKEVLRRDAQAVIDKLRSVGAIDEQHNI
ncbi:MAG: PqqD family protein [Ruminococcus sp.]|nr:PqqD family protein [Ruminococcus sp.]